MSRHAPGTRDWWLETAAIAAAGVALAALLWDRPLLQPTVLSFVPQPSPTLADMFDAGCVTSEHLSALRDGQTVLIRCGDGMIDGPPDPRPFP